MSVLQFCHFYKTPEKSWQIGEKLVLFVWGVFPATGSWTLGFSCAKQALSHCSPGFSVVYISNYQLGEEEQSAGSKAGFLIAAEKWRVRSDQGSPVLIQGKITCSYDFTSTKFEDLLNKSIHETLKWDLYTLFVLVFWHCCYSTNLLT